MIARIKVGLTDRSTDQFAPPPPSAFAPPDFDTTNSNDEQTILTNPSHITDVSADQFSGVLHDSRNRLAEARGEGVIEPGAHREPSRTDPNAINPRPGLSMATISREPIRYNLPPAPPEIPKNEQELDIALQGDQTSGDVDMEDGDPTSELRSSRPGQAHFAARLMAKYGWEKGSGLGASGTGILKPLQVKIEKQKKKSDADGGGVYNKGKGKILGGDRGIEPNAHGRFGAMSEVIVLERMVDGLDLDAEMEGGLMQEIGEECGEKVRMLGLSITTQPADLIQYGRVERVFIDRSSYTPDRTGARVFIKFTSQLSGLRVGH